MKALKYRVFAAGDSYNDIQMLTEADLGLFFQAPRHIRDEYSDINGVENYAELKKLNIDDLISLRIEKYDKIGEYEEK